MKKSLFKMVALAIAGAIIPVYAYVCGSERDDNNFMPDNQNEPEESTEDEEVAVDTQ